MSICGAIERLLYLAGRFQPRINNDLTAMTKNDQKKHHKNNDDDNSDDDNDEENHLQPPKEMDDVDRKNTGALRTAALDYAAQSLQNNIQWLNQLHRSCATALGERARAGVDAALARISQASSSSSAVDTTSTAPHASSSSFDEHDDQSNASNSDASYNDNHNEPIENSKSKSTLKWLSKQPFTVDAAATLQYRTDASYHRVVRNIFISLKLF